MSDEGRRSKYDIYADIVETVARNELSHLTKISYGANLPVDRAKSLLQLLILHGFVRELVVGDSKKYRATKRGLEFVETYSKMKKFFAALAEPAALSMSRPTSTVLPNRLKTGYRDLDDALLGGIPENYAVVLTCASSDEKDLLVSEFMRSGVNDEQATFYITADVNSAVRLTQEFQSDFYSFICNPQSFKILEGLPNVYRMRGVENLTDITIALSSAFRSLGALPTKGRRACIDIVSDILLQHHAVDTRRWLAGLIPEIKSNGFTILATLNPYMHSPEEVQAILGLFEGELDIYEKRIGEDDRKYLRIKKMLGQRYENSALVLEKTKLGK